MNFFIKAQVLHVSIVNDTHRENCVLLNSVQEFFEIKGWLLLNFFIYLHKINFYTCCLLSHIEEQMFEKQDSSNKQK